MFPSPTFGNEERDDAFQGDNCATGGKEHRVGGMRRFTVGEKGSKEEKEEEEEDGD